MQRLVHTYAPSLSLHRHRWFARDLHLFLAYCRSRGQDKLDVELLAIEYLEIVRRSKLSCATPLLSRSHEGTEFRLVLRSFVNALERSLTNAKAREAQ